MDRVGNSLQRLSIVRVASAIRLEQTIGATRRSVPINLSTPNAVLAERHPRAMTLSDAPPLDATHLVCDATSGAATGNVSPSQRSDISDLIIASVRPGSQWR